MTPDERSDESIISVVFTTTDISSIQGFITWLPKLCLHVEYFFFHISFDCLFFLMSFFSFLYFFIYFFIYFFHCVYFMWCGAVICCIWFPILIMTVTSILEARHQEKRNSNNHNHVIVRFIIYCHCCSGLWNASVSPEQRTTVAHTFTDLTTLRTPLSQHPPILAPTIHPTVLPRQHLYVTPHLFSAIILVASSTETIKTERTSLNSPVKGTGQRLCL